jgi:SEC-C motif-containing protein
MNPCPCGTGKTYANCCGVFITHEKLPATPEELMRSRYTAFTQVNIEYIGETMKPPAAEKFNFDIAHAWASKITWSGLKVLKTKHKGNKGMVEFIARFKSDGEENNFHEISQFHCIDGKWFYVDGIHPETRKTQ